MAFPHERLTPELTLDPLGIGYLGMTDVQVEVSINAVNRVVNLSEMTGDDVFNIADIPEMTVLADVALDNWVSFCARDGIDPFGPANVQLVKRIFGAASQTVTDLAAARTVTVSRATELRMPTVHRNHVAYARGVHPPQHQPATLPLTWTLAGLASGAYVGSVGVTHDHSKHRDVLASGFVMTGPSPIVGSNIIISAYGSFDGGATFTAGMTGLDGAVPVPGREDELFALSGIEIGASGPHNWGPVAIAQAFDGLVPDVWGTVAFQDTGEALPSGHGANYYGAA